MTEDLETEMIDHKAATDKALSYLKQMIADASDPRVEEVEKSRDGSCWVVTFGYKPDSAGSGISEIFSRKYKQVSITAENGDFVSIKSRIAG